MPFKIPFSAFAERSGVEALALVDRAEKKRLGDLRVYDLLLHDGQPIFNGVYLFYSPSGECLYAGKNSSQKFVERIPWHFALDEGAWMNHYLKRTRKHGGLASLPEAAVAAENDTLLLIPVTDRTFISSLEKFFRLFARPRYNAYSERYLGGYGGVDLNAPLPDVLTHMSRAV